MEKAMDFSTLVRRELQALCKKNKIPANITNVAMIEALNALETVEGIEELLNPGESEMEQSPEKNVKTQQSVSRSSYRTSTRIKPAREEDEKKNQTTARRQGTSRKIAGDVEQAAASAAPAARSSRKKDPALVEESAEDVAEKEIKAVPLTPAAAPATLRRGTRVSSRRNINSDLIEEKKVYSTRTRRSVRMSEKKVVDSDFREKETTQPIKMDAFSEDMSEVSEIAVVTSLGADLPTLSEECSETTDVSADIVSSVDSEMKEAKIPLAEELVNTDLVAEEAKKMESIEVHVISGVEEQSDDNMSDECSETTDVSADVVSSVNSEMQEAKISLAEELVSADLVTEEAKQMESIEVNVISGVEEQSDDNMSDEIEEDLTAADVDSNKMELETTQDLSCDVTDDAEIKPVPEVEEQFDDNNAADESEIEQELELSFAAKAESNEIDGELEVDSIGSVAEIASNIELDSDKSLPAADFTFQNEDTPVLDETADEPAVDSDGLSDDESDFSTDSELDEVKEDVSEESEAEAETTKDELSVKTVKATTPRSVKKSSPIKTDFSALILADDEPLLVSSSPLKKSLSPSPLKKSASKSPLAARVLDDKENTDHLSGKKLELTKEKKLKAKKKDEIYGGISLRKLNKMLKVQLQISNKNKNSMNNETECNAEEAVNMRPALQALPENH